MLSIEGAADLRRIVVLNPKGGVGKTTMASNLAGYFAATGHMVAIIDMDRQGTSTHWLGRRSAELPSIHGVFAAPETPGVPADFRVTLPPEIDLAVVDSPAGVPREALPDFTVGSHAIVVPVMPSEFDIHAASRLIADLLLVARVSRENGRLGVVANRVKERTLAFKQLMKFLNRLSIPIIGVIRDSQNYATAAREGLSVHEMPRSLAGKDLDQWQPVTLWLEQRLATPLNERDLLRPRPKTPTTTAPGVRPVRWRAWKPATAAGVALILVLGLFWQFNRAPESTAPETTVTLNPGATGTSVPAPSPGTDTELRPSAESTAATAPLARPSATGGFDAGTSPDGSPDGLFAGSPSEPEMAGSDALEPELTPAETLARNWRLTGVVRAGGEPVVLLTDPTRTLTRSVTTDSAVDGWRLKDAGADFAVLTRNGDEVRLKLTD